ncbi:MAG: tyrosine-type recombinase/integrase [Dietzia sp.]
MSDNAREPTPDRRRSRNANGESTVYQDADGRWHAWITMGLRPDGRIERRHRTAPTRKAVVAKLRELERARDRGDTGAPAGKVTLGHWLQQWLRTQAPRRLRPKSMASYGTDINKHLVPGLGHHRLDRLTTRHIEDFYVAMAAETHTVGDQTRPRYRPATIDHVHRTLRSALKDAVRDGLIPKNPAAGAQRPSSNSLGAIEHQIEPLSVDEVRAIIAVAREMRNGTRYLLALSHGLRQGEALGLPWAKVQLDGALPQMRVLQQLQQLPWLHGCERTADQWACGGRRAADCPSRHSGGLVLTQVKTRRGERPLALDPVSADLLRQHRENQDLERLTAGNRWEEHGLVFTQPNGRPIGPSADSRQWKTLLENAGVREARLHDARHTAATFLLVQEVDPRVVMAIMGWSTSSQLHRYQHVVDALRQEAATRMATYLYDPE